MSNGGKADSLRQLKEAGFLVPRFFVCDSNWSEKEIISPQRLFIRYFLTNFSTDIFRTSKGSIDSNKNLFL